MHSKRLLSTACALLTLSVTGFCDTVRNHILHHTFPELSELSAIYTEQYNSLLKSAVEEFALSLTAEEQAAQLFHVSFPNKEYLFRNSTGPAAGGFLFFGFNIPDSAEDLIEQNVLIRNFYREKGMVPPFYSLDCEGGYVNRLSTVSGRIQSPESVAVHLNPESSLSYYTAVSRMISSAGFDVNLAPVIETANDSNIEFLGNRTYGTAEDVAQYAGDFITAMIQNNVYPVVKHYPGNTSADPHLGLPVLQTTVEAYTTDYLKIFDDFLAAYQTGVLAAHTVVPCIDNTPVCLSPLHLENLRSEESISEDLLIFSDDLLMKALTRNGYPPDVSVVAAVKAGVDVVMFSVSQWEEYLHALLDAANTDEYLSEKIRESCCRILRWKCRQGLLSVTCIPKGQTLEMTVSVPEPLTETELNQYCAAAVESFDDARKTADSLYWRYF